LRVPSEPNVRRSWPWAWLSFSEDLGLRAGWAWLSFSEDLGLRAG
jgi:hypothetical protein